MAQTQNVPFVLTPFLHVGDPDDPDDRTRKQYTQPALLYLAQRADLIFVQTEIEKQTLRQCGIEDAKLIVQGMGVDLESCTGGRREWMRQQWGVSDNDIVIGHLANKSYEKGTNDLLDACALAWKRGAQFRVVLAGPEMTSFQRKWEGYSHQSRVIRMDILGEQEKRDFFGAIDVFALPSRSDSFGIVLLEAWANGVPNVGYRAGGIASVIHHEEDGLLVKCGDVPALSEALTKLIEDKELRAGLGKSGRERTLRDFQWEDKLCLVERELSSC